MADQGVERATAPGPWREAQGVPPVRAVTADDVKAALAAGWADFRAAPALGLAVGAAYMAGGWGLLWLLEAREWRGLTFPLVAGFALVGPFVATILYEISRRREHGQSFGWGDVPAMVKATARRQIIYLGFALMFWLAVWSRIALMLWAIFFHASPERFFDYAGQLLTTEQGITFLITGHLFGAFFAFVAFCMSVVAFPLLLDRDADVITAIVTSFKAVLASPKVMLGWGVAIGVILAAASLPAFIGLVVALPLLGHASWHLYRKVVAA